MKKVMVISSMVVLGGIFGFSIVTENELYLGFSLTLLLVLVSKALSGKNSNSLSMDSFSEKAVKKTFYTFSILAAFMSLLTPLIFPGMAAKFGWATRIEGEQHDFVRIFINDMREQAYVFSVALIVNIIILLILKLKNRKVSN